MKTFIQNLPDLSKIDLGSSLLSISIAIGFFLAGAVVFRSIEIPIRIYLDNRRGKNKLSKTKINQNQKKGF